MSSLSLYAIVLAAGRSSRFGSTKQLALCEGEPLVTRAVRSAENLCGSQTLLVTGNDWRKVAAACEPMQGFIAHNPRYADGIASSIAHGVRGISPVADAVLLLLADQPRISVEHLRSLADAWASSPASICASEYAGTQGPPVIFPAAYFSELMALQGDRGAKAVLGSSGAKVITIPCEAAAIDIDTPEDLGNN
jgi:molybdenum cofactor cytidylyltransferase